MSYFMCVRDFGPYERGDCVRVPGEYADQFARVNAGRFVAIDPPERVQAQAFDVVLRR